MLPPDFRIVSFGSAACPNCPCLLRQGPELSDCACRCHEPARLLEGFNPRRADV